MKVSLANGILIDAETGKREVNTEINRAFAGETVHRASHKPAYEGSTRRYLDDLPMPALQSRPLAIIVAYTLFGLNEADIAHILNTDVETVRRYQQGNEYNGFLDAILQNIREHDTDKVRKKLNAAATGAADTIVSLMNSDDEKVQLAAAKDVLDRTGNRPADVVEHKHSMEGGLTIRIVKTEEKPVKVDIDL